MKKPYSRIVHHYFSEYVSMILTLFLVFAVSFVGIAAISGFNQTIWLIPLVFLFLCLLYTPFFRSYIRAYRELKAENTEKRKIKISEIIIDEKASLYAKHRHSPVRRLAGKEKYKMIDENQNVYLLTAANDKVRFIGFHPMPTFYVVIEFLKESGLVLSMKLIENTKSVKEKREQERNIRFFKSAFCHYFNVK